jgi:hypothetical protein
MNTFAIFSTLPADARVFVTLGESGSYDYVGDRDVGVAPADFEAACRETIVRLEANNRSFVHHGICIEAGLSDADRVARSIYDRNGRARVELRGELEGLILYLDTQIPEGAKGLDAWSDALCYPWIFVGARFESPEGEYGDQDAAHRLVAAAAMVVEIGLVPRQDRERPEHSQGRGGAHHTEDRRK